MRTINRRKAIKIVSAGVLGTTVIPLISCSEGIGLFEPSKSSLPQAFQPKFSANTSTIAEAVRLVDDFMRWDMSGGKLSTSGNSNLFTARTDRVRSAWDTINIIKNYEITGSDKQKHKIIIKVNCTYYGQIGGETFFPDLGERDGRALKINVELAGSKLLVDDFLSPNASKEAALTHTLEQISMISRYSQEYINKRNRFLADRFHQRFGYDKNEYNKMFSDQLNDRLKNLEKIVNQLENL